MTVSSVSRRFGKRFWINSTFKIDSNQSPPGKMLRTDSEIRMHDGPYTTIFPNEIGHGMTLGRSFLTLRVPTKMLWCPGWQIYHQFLEWMGLYIYFDKNIFRNQNFEPASFETKNGCLQKSTKTKMTALAKSIDSKPPLTICY